MKPHYQKLTRSTLERAAYWGETLQKLIQIAKEKELNPPFAWTGFDKRTLEVITDNLVKMRIGKNNL